MKIVHRRRLVLLPLLAALAFAALGVVACGGSDYDAGPLGAVKVEGGADIHIRSMTGLSGSSSSGLPTFRAVEMAIDDYGPIHGRRVTLDAGVDSGCDAAVAAQVAETVAADARVVGVIGTSCSSAATAALPIISRAGLVMISPSNTAPSLTSDLQGNAGSGNGPGYYRTAGNDLHTGLAVAQFAYEELGLRNVAVFHDGGPYTSGLATAFSVTFEGLGGQTVTATVAKGDLDMTDALMEVAAAAPDGLFLPLHRPDSTLVIQQKAGFAALRDVTIIGGDALLSTDFLSQPESDGVYLAGPNLEFEGNVNEATGVNGLALYADYLARYGEVPSSSYMAHAYDAATLLLRAIDTVAEVVGDDLYIDRAKVREALSALNGFQGVIGPITCDAFGDCGTGRLFIRHHTDPGVTDGSKLPIVYRFEP